MLEAFVCLGSIHSSLDNDRDDDSLIVALKVVVTSDFIADLPSAENPTLIQIQRRQCFSRSMHSLELHKYC